MGKKGGGSAPKAPNPRDTAAAQTGTNIGTALAETALNNVNQETPYGNLMYDVTGSYDFTDPYTGQTYSIPTYTARQTYTDAGQQLLDTTMGTQQNLADLAQTQSSFLNDYMAQPFDGSNEATEARLMELGRKRLDPALSDRRAAMEQDLANRGIAMGSRAYDSAMNRLSQSENDAYNQLLLTGNQQAFQQAQAQRNQPINEITALMSGSQVSQPNYVNTPQSNIATTDVAGLINQNYQNKLAAYNQQQAQQQQMLGGLFSLGSSLLMGM